jgi:hypothetical protein
MLYGDDGDDEWALRFGFKVGERVIGCRIKQKSLLAVSWGLVELVWVGNI